MNYSDIIDFWFKEIDSSLWFKKDKNFDQNVRSRFSSVLNLASRGELTPWRSSPEGALAEIIVLDQFSRNIYRDLPEAFAQDRLALKCALDAVAQGFDKKLKVGMRTFMYMPFMHTEDKEVHARAIELFSSPDMPPESLKFELLHKKIIDQFGRYPHRNHILGRVSTPEELEFLKQPNSGF